MKKIFLFLLIAFTGIRAQQNSGIETAKLIADRIIGDTSFELVDYAQTPAVDLQVIDFLNCPENSVNTASSYIQMKEAGKLKFGISYSSPVEVLLGDVRVFKSAGRPEFDFAEIAYGIFRFNDTLELDLKKGLNKITVASAPAEKRVIYLREITPGEEPATSSFVLPGKHSAYVWPWCFDGKDSGADISDCVTLKPSTLKQLKINPDAVYKRESYAEWTYANGAMLSSFLTLAENGGGSGYSDFVKRCCDFTIENLPLFRNQYYEKHELRGTDHRIFRKGMLDDAGAPLLPYLDLAVRKESSSYDSLISVMADYVMKGQNRLPDGTLCRPEPEEWTIWADDLFMSVPLTLKMGRLTENEKYFDEAALQMKNFYKYLFDDSAGVCRHGWFSRTNQQSPVRWGRANGWIIWAVSEALLSLPQNHPDYAAVKELFRKHINGIIGLQDESGMWHQVLNDKTSFLESSCTAMFITGISRAIRLGIIDEEYSVNVSRAWNALSKNISSDGIVKDICRGTGIGFDEDFYRKRQRFENDPRGIGAVITAAVETEKLNSFIKK